MGEREAERREAENNEVLKGSEEAEILPASAELFPRVFIIGFIQPSFKCSAQTDIHHLSWGLTVQANRPHIR